MSSFRRPLSLLRAEGGKYVEGVWTPGERRAVAGFSGSVQPAPGADTQKLPEGLRSARAYVIFSSLEVLTANPQASPPQEADFLKLRDGVYRAMLCDPWQNDVINHFRTLFVRLTEAEAPSAC